MRSMTGFGRATENIDGRDIVVEIKSVNNRYLDCSVKVPRLYGFLEEKIKTYVQSGVISRGKIEIFVSINELESSGTTISLDEAYLKSYLSALYRLRDEYGLKDDITVSSVASNFNVFSVNQADEDTDRDWADVLVVLKKAIEAFCRMRDNEGENIRRDLEAKKAHLVKLRDKIDSVADRAVEVYKSRLEAKLRTVLEQYGVEGFDESRIITECAIFADKTAIDEELVRLKSHFDSFDKIIAADDAVGRKIDFLIQEINREINTIGSKCSDIEITNIVVEMKSELEKIREQIQNIE